MNETVICQFAKWPDLGRVKTRLASVLGDERALQVHIDLVTAVMQSMHQYLQIETNAAYQLWLDRDDTHICFEQPEGLSQELARFCQLLGNERVIRQEQAPGDLGYKMNEAIHRLSGTYRKVIIVGSDCPSVTADVVNEASIALDNNDLVLAPADDGGFVLLGANTKSIKAAEQNWLSAISWGTEKVLEETLAVFETHDFSVGLLDTLWDVDEIEDYHRWLEQT